MIPKSKDDVMCSHLKDADKLIPKSKAAVMLSLLKNGDNRPIEDITTEFSSKIPRSLYSLICSAFVVILEERAKSMEPIARLITYCLLHQTYSSSRSATLLTNTASDENAEILEKLFVLHLLNGTKEVLKLSPAEYIDKFVSSSHSLLTLHQLQKQFHEKTQPLCDLIAKAMKEPLARTEYEQVLLELETNPKLVYHCGLTPTKLPQLVENNPLTAVEVLTKLKDSSDLSEYLTVLMNMELGFYSMEVVDRLTTAVELPTELVHKYIKHCITSTEETKDKYMQNRLVRQVFVLLHGLIRNQTVDNNIKDQDIDLLYEMQAFCIQFLRVDGADSLFRLLRTLNDLC